ncbi:type II toxin-antitoxin system VapC family toxin [Variovorax robiniae]|uniref:Ribonuclease VapC n=1 Tax=Variovorax robiniae TaxID=1836199 RepID=A0ABU8X9D5_9BURK
MILLDTNVLSEVNKRTPESQVRAWVDAQLPGSLFISAITVMEVMDGIGRLTPGGKSRAELDAIMSGAIQLYDGRILPFDYTAAVGYAQIMERTRRAGYNVGTPDAMIAAIAAVRGFAVATRDEAAFRAMDARVINPWTD